MTQTQGVYTIMIFGFISNLISNIPWSLVFLFTPYFGVHLYTIKKREECLTIQKNISGCSHTTDGGKGYGYSVGPWYIAYIGESGDEPSVSMVSTKATYERLSKSRDIEVSFTVDCVKSGSIRVFERFGSYGNSYYRSRNLRIGVEPREPQRVILNSVKVLLDQKKSAVLLIHGPPNIGKTMISLLLANELKGTYCSSMAPWEPGDSLACLYSEAEPTENTPLIVAFDEIDGPLQRIHEGISDHKNLRTKVKDKQGWNQMLDEIQMGFYPHMVIILTTNKRPEFFNDMDPSYIRDHRVDKIYELS
jgi:SpoVK/Ycf46/Vps4 family AAA+-type ATPase